MLLRYILAGGLSYIIELAFMYLFLFFGLSSVASVGIAFWVGLSIAFFLQKAFAFKDTGTSKKKTALQMGQYGALVAVNYTFTLALVYYHDAIGGPVYTLLENFPLVNQIEDFNLLFARTLALGITTVWNFVLYKYIIFRQK